MFFAYDKSLETLKQNVSNKIQILQIKYTIQWIWHDILMGYPYIMKQENIYRFSEKHVFDNILLLSEHRMWYNIFIPALQKIN